MNFLVKFLRISSILGVIMASEWRESALAQRGGSCFSIFCLLLPGGSSSGLSACLFQGCCSTFQEVFPGAKLISHVVIFQAVVLGASWLSSWVVFGGSFS